MSHTNRIAKYLDAPRPTAAADLEATIWDWGYRAGREEAFAVRCCWMLYGFVCGALVAAVIAWIW